MIYEVILPNGDRAEAPSLGGILLAARILSNEAAPHMGAARRVQRQLLVTCDGQYDGRATTTAREAR